MEQRFAAPPDRVFAAITDHEAMGTWLDGATVTLEKIGQADRNGVGAVRRIHARGLTIFEEVIHFEAPREMQYKVLRGAPLTEHLGTIRVIPDGTGSRVDYTIRFGCPLWAGGELTATIIARVLGGELRAGMARLAQKIG